MMTLYNTSPVYLIVLINSGNEVFVIVTLTKAISIFKITLKEEILKSSTFQALKTKHDTPKYGLIYHAQLVGQASSKLKGKVS